MLFDINEFFPTPKALLEKITKGFKWSRICTILEPSAGKGDIVEFIKDTTKYIDKDFDIDCVEINPELQSVLRGKNFRLVHNDFLTFHTYKHYDLIILNPPFSAGAAHLTKALDMQKEGGAVICILNAETLKNPYSNERKTLVKRLKDLNADIEYMQGEFTSAERPTGVEVAIVKVYVEQKKHNSFIYDSLKKKSYSDKSYQDVTALAPNDFIEAIVAMYNLEVESGIKLIREYQAMCPYILQSLQDDTYNDPILTMNIDGKDLSINAYLKCVRRKYWNALFNNSKFTGNMTTNLTEKHQMQVEELSDYDFSYYNIKCIQEEMTHHLVKGIEDCIIELFDTLSHQYSYSDEFSKNIHYYNGWKTNKSWIINQKIILPNMSGFERWQPDRFQPDREVKEKLMDIERALDYLDGGRTGYCSMYRQLDRAVEIGQTKKIQLKYFLVTFYKKGTCHIEFTNLELLKKLNIFGSQQKRWLPPGYGKKTYQEMGAEEQAVVDGFEGEESYQAVLSNANYFIYDPKRSVPMIEEVLP